MKWAVLLLGIAALLAVWKLGDSPERPDERVLGTGSIRVGYATEVPYAFRDAAGRVTGESPEVARAVLGRIGIDSIEWVASDFAALIPNLLAGRIDMIAAGMFVSAERSRLVRFSHPSACVDNALLVRRGNPGELRDLTDVAGRPEARVAVISGAVEEEQAARAGVARSAIRGFASFELAVEALRQGIVDAVALSGPTVQYAADSDPELERAGAATAGAPIAGCPAFAFRLDDEKLSTRFDAGLKAFFASEEHLRLVRPFGFRAEHLRVPAGAPVQSPGTSRQGSE